MATIYIDGDPYEVKEGWNLLHTCLSLGFNIPYFCWHPAMGSIGACRQCAVRQFKDENDTQGTIVMSCMTPVKDGMRISIDDPGVREFRASVIEWLMVNHPHDCPVCDEGGECHLQDMTVLTGHTYRDFDFQKRTHRNQYLGPFVTHEMNRCIACYRCLRFYREQAGGRDFDVFGAHDHVYFGRFEDGPLQSEFSGNLVEVCPTGVFTDKSLHRHYSRKWDLQTAPSICVHCGLGCNTIPGERYGELRRIRNRYHHDVNGYFLCDRGRYGYEFVNSDLRIRMPLLRHEGGETASVTSDEAVRHAADLLGPGNRVIGIGSPRASLEANFALRDLVGPSNFYQGVSDNNNLLVAAAIQVMQSGPAKTPSLHSVERNDAVLILGEDATSVAPMLALALRQSVRQIPLRIEEQLLHIPSWQDAAVQEAIQSQEGPLIIATPGSTRLDDVATNIIHLPPEDLARFGFAVAHAIDENAPAVDGLSDAMATLVTVTAEQLTKGQRPLVISGINVGTDAVMHAAANVASALHKVVGTSELLFTVPECNSMGLGLMGGGGLNAAQEAVESGEVDTIVILENDLYRRAGAAEINALLDAVPHVIAIDHLTNQTTERAELVLPAATFAETDGTLVNNEGRAQRYYQVFVPEGSVKASWRWINEIKAAASHADVREWQIVDDVIADMAEAMPVFAMVPDIAPPAGFRLLGQRIPRESHRYSGRTAMNADVAVSEPKPPQDPDTPFSFTMEGYPGQPPAALIPRYWAPHWNSVQALNKFQEEINGPLRGGDPGRLLIAPKEDAQVSYFDQIPDACEMRSGQWRVIPQYHIFGSEPLSMLSPGIAQLAPEPYVAVSAADAEKLGVESGDDVTVMIGDQPLVVCARIDGSIQDGIARLPMGLKNVPTVKLPMWTEIRKETENE